MRLNSKRGQIFLILTIFAITFLVGITSILIDVQRSQYYDPAPDSNEVFEVLTNTNFAIEKIFRIQIAVNTQATAPSGTGTYDASITNQLSNLVNFLQSRGFAASINLVGNTIYTQPTIGLSTVVVLTGTISIFIESTSGIIIEQTVSLVISYEAVITGTTLSVSTTQNGLTSYLRDAIVTPQTTGLSVSQGNGAFSLTGADNYNVLTNDNVILVVNLP